MSIRHVLDHRLKSRLRQAILFLLLALCLCLLLSSLPGGDRAVAQAGVCESSSKGSYTVTACLSQPGNGAKVRGVLPVTATTSIAGASSGLLELYFYLDGTYLINDRTSPYSFDLPSDHFVDGAHSLAVEARMKDGFNSSRATINLTFQNGVSSPPVNTKNFKPALGSGSITIAAVGDGAGSYPEAGSVSDLIVSMAPDLFLYLGDVYEKGSYTEFFDRYGTPDRGYGRLRSITNPTIGNHEYDTGSPAGYFFYWDNVPNYYSYNSGGWHFIALNLTEKSNPVTPGTPQYDWLVKDLDNNTLPCVLVYFHHPRYSIGPQGDTDRVAQAWSLMAQKGVDVALTGHDHSYQRWKALDGNGIPSAQGITEFVVGTGGNGTQAVVRTDSRVVYSSTAFGALFMDLAAGHLDFRFVDISNRVLDSGRVTCSGTPPPVATATSTPVPTATRTKTPLPAATATKTPPPAATAAGTPVPTTTSTNTPLPTGAMTDTTGPTAISTGTPQTPPANPDQADSDGDGLPDLWEVAFGLDPGSSTGADGAQGDPDGDGISNLGEYRRQTDPLVPDSTLTENAPAEGVPPHLYLPLIESPG